MRAADSAATKIQAGFRGYRVRKQLRLARLQGKKTDGKGGRQQLESSGGGTLATAACAAIGSSPVSAEDPGAAVGEAPTASPHGGDDASSAAEQLERCATKIQAGVRGFLVRRKRFHQSRAAATIQATFRAFRARREARLRAAAKL